MTIYRGLAPLKAYKGDMQPVNIYHGATKLAGWHAASTSGQSPLSVDCDYDVPPDALTIDGKCVQTPAVWGTNIIANGDFSDGTTGWSAANAGFSISGSVASILAKAQWGRMQQTALYGVSANHIYYCAALVNSDSTLVKLALEKADPPYTVIGYKYVTVVSSPSRISFTGKSTTDLTNISFRINDGRTSGWTTFTVDKCTFIDLTAAFGAGKEPTATQIDAMLAANHANSWFNATGLLTTDTTTYTANSPSPSFPAPITTITGDVGITGADGASSNTATVDFGSAVCASLPDGTHDSYDAITGVLTKRVGKVVFDGSADEVWTLQSINGYGIANFANPITGWNTTALKSMCDRLAEQTTLISGTTTEGFLVSTGNFLFIRILSTRASTVADFRAWLASNPVTVYYELATPTTVQLTPHLPVVRTGIKTLSIGADVAPTISATVKSMD